MDLPRFCRSQETEALRGEGTCLTKVTQLVVELGFEPLTPLGLCDLCLMEEGHGVLWGVGSDTPVIPQSSHSPFRWAHREAGGRGGT